MLCIIAQSKTKQGRQKAHPQFDGTKFDKVCFDGYEHEHIFGMDVYMVYILYFGMNSIIYHQNNEMNTIQVISSHTNKLQRILIN